MTIVITETANGLEVTETVDPGEEAPGGSGALTTADITDAGSVGKQALQAATAASVLALAGWSPLATPMVVTWPPASGGTAQNALDAITTMQTVVFAIGIYTNSAA